MADRLHRRAGRGAKWRYTLPETENISTARSSPLVFRSSTPKHDDESNQTSGLDKNNDSQSGGKKRKLSSDSDLIQKKGKEKKKTKWVWSDDKVEEMLKFVREYKSTYDFQRIDFEADLQSLYTEVRRCMTSLYPDDFGTPSLNACFRFSTIMAWFSLKSSSSNNSPFYMSRSSECFIVFHSRV